MRTFAFAQLLAATLAVKLYEPDEKKLPKELKDFIKDFDEDDLIEWL